MSEVEEEALDTNNNSNSRSHSHSHSHNAVRRERSESAHEFADALSDTHSDLGRSLSALPPKHDSSSSRLAHSADTVTAEEARRRQAQSSRLLHDAAVSDDASAALAEEARRRHDDTANLLDDDDDGRLDRVAGWVKSAANYIAIEARPLSFAAPRTAHRRAASTPDPAVTDATGSICSFPDCVAPLNIAVSRFHCRRCNGWYCAQHAGHPSLGMKLRVGSGEPHPGGVWSRVCQRCFHDRFAVRDDAPPVRTWLDEFAAERSGLARDLRQKEALLMGRLRRLREFHGGLKIPFRVYEQQVVHWEHDSSASLCRLCTVRFTALNRKHHCRLCGELVCGEPTCSLFHPLECAGGEPVELRICVRCEYIAVRRAALRAELALVSELVPLHQEMAQVKRQIGDILPRFREQLLRFESEMDRTPQPIEQRVLDARHEATAARDTLILLFRHYEGLARKIRAMAAAGEAGRLCANIHRAALLYLQGHMFTLQMLPRLDMRRLQRPPSARMSRSASSVHSASSASIFARLLRRGEGGGGGEILPELPQPANVVALQEKVNVLQEQKEQLEGFMAEAVQAQRFDDVRSLRLSLEEINREISRTRRILHPS